MDFSKWFRSSTSAGWSSPDSPDALQHEVPDQDILLPAAPNSGQYFWFRHVRVQYAPVEPGISAARLVTVLVEDQTLVMVRSSHGIVLAWSRKPPHMWMTMSPSMSSTSEAPSSSPESRFRASAPRTAANRSSHTP